MRVNSGAKSVGSRYLINLLSLWRDETRGPGHEHYDDEAPLLSKPEARGGVVVGGGLRSSEQAFRHGETRGEALFASRADWPRPCQSSPSPLRLCQSSPSLSAGRLATTPPTTAVIESQCSQVEVS